MNTKSSPRVVSGERAQRSLQAWQPEDLDVPRLDSWTMDVAALYDLFAPPQKETAEDPNYKGPAAAWSPNELSLEWFEPEIAQPILSVPVMPEIEVVPESPMVPLEVSKHTEDEIAAMLAEAHQQAEEIILHAQQTADQMLREAQQDIEAERKAAYNAGHEAAQTEVRPMLAALYTASEETHAWKDELFRQSEPIVLAMVQDIAYKLFGDGVALSDEALQHNLNRVLENARSLGDIKIYLNPADVAHLDPGWREMRAAMTGERIQIIPTEGVKRGGCFVNGQMGSIDARVGTQLRTIFQAIDTTAPSEEAKA